MEENETLSTACEKNKEKTQGEEEALSKHTLMLTKETLNSAVSNVRKPVIMTLDDIIPPRLEEPTVKNGRVPLKLKL